MNKKKKSKKPIYSTYGIIFPRVTSGKNPFKKKRLTDGNK
jgi:hypothetical protein